MSTIPSPTTGRGTNARVELARYTIAAGERIVYGQRVLGVVRLTDVPADGRGRHYVIERVASAISVTDAPGPRPVQDQTRLRHAIALPGFRSRYQATGRGSRRWTSGSPRSRLGA